MPYGVDARAFRPDPLAGALVRSELGLAPDTPLVISVSRLVHKKGLAYLLEALPRILADHPSAVLVVAGYGDLREELERRATELGVTASVRFPGQLERELKENSWLTLPVSDAQLFDLAYEDRWTAAWRSLGVDVATVSTRAGHA